MDEEQSRARCGAGVVCFVDSQSNGRAIMHISSEVQPQSIVIQYD